MPFTIEDLAQRLFGYDLPSLAAEDLTGGAFLSGEGDIFPDMQTVILGAQLQNVPRGWGGRSIQPYWGPLPPGDPYTRIWMPSVAQLYWLPDARLVRVDHVVYTEQYFFSPYASVDPWVHWVCPAPAQLLLWRLYNPSFS